MTGPVFSENEDKYLKFVTCYFHIMHTKLSICWFPISFVYTYIVIIVSVVLVSFQIVIVVGHPCSILLYMIKKNGSQTDKKG